MTASLVSSLHYLNSRAIVHRELKPTDLIVGQDESIQICGYGISVLDEHRFVRASEVGGPSYMAPEIYDDERDGNRVRDPQTDVFSFGLIYYAIVCGRKIFPSTMSATVITRRAMSGRSSDRPVMAADVPPVIRGMISASWVAKPEKRTSFEAPWNRMPVCEFQLA